MEVLSSQLQTLEVALDVILLETEETYCSFRPFQHNRG